MSSYKELHLDVNVFMEDFILEMMQEANYIISSMASEMEGQANWSKAKSDREKTEAYMQAVDQIIATIESGAYAIVDSFGTGRYIDDTNEQLSKYMNSEYWNELRTGKTIVGRGEGTYTNIFGEEVVSSGAMAGKPVNVHEFRPSGAIQRTEAWWFGERIQGRLNSRIKNFLTKNMGKYFKYY